MANKPKTEVILVLKKSDFSRCIHLWGGRYETQSCILHTLLLLLQGEERYQQKSCTGSFNCSHVFPFLCKILIYKVIIYDQMLTLYHRQCSTCIWKYRSATVQKLHFFKIAFSLFFLLESHRPCWVWQHRDSLVSFPSLSFHLCMYRTTTPLIIKPLGHQILVSVRLRKSRRSVDHRNRVSVKLKTTSWPQHQTHEGGMWCHEWHQDLLQWSTASHPPLTNQ